MPGDIPEYADAPVDQRQKELRAAQERSRRNLTDVIAQGPEVSEVAASLRRLRTQNQYGERMALAMGLRSR